jgi:membrane protease subunit HflC
MKRSPLTLTVALVLIIVFGLLLFTYQVRKSEVAVVTLFGRIVNTKTDPGLGFRWPWPIERVDKLDQRIQNFEDINEQMRLADQNTLMLEVYVGWHITVPAQFYPKFRGSVEMAQERLEELVRNAKTEVAGRYVFSDFVSADQKQMKFAQFEKDILTKVQQSVAAQDYGIDVNFVQIKKIALPESVTKNVFDRMTSERQFYISQIDASGEEIATKIKSKADSDAAKILSDADADAFKIRAVGEAEMMHSLSVLQQNTNLAIFNMQNAALAELLKDRTTLILDQSTTPLNLLQPIPPQKFESTNTSAGKIP